MLIYVWSVNKKREGGGHVSRWNKWMENVEKKRKRDSELRDKKGKGKWGDGERSGAGWKGYISEERDMWEDCVNNRHINEAIWITLITATIKDRSSCSMWQKGGWRKRAEWDRSLSEEDCAFNWIETGGLLKSYLLLLFIHRSTWAIHDKRKIVWLQSKISCISSWRAVLNQDINTERILQRSDHPTHHC